jgi:hypothetical protein
MGHTSEHRASFPMPFGAPREQEVHARESVPSQRRSTAGSYLNPNRKIELSYFCKIKSELTPSMSRASTALSQS